MFVIEIRNNVDCNNLENIFLKESDEFAILHNEKLLNYIIGLHKFDNRYCVCNLN